MIGRKSLTLSVLLFGLLVTCSTLAQSDGSAGKKQRKAEKVKQEQAKRQMKADELGRKRHIKLQSASVKKRWKKNKRRFKHVDAFDRRPGLIQRIFPRKRPQSN